MTPARQGSEDILRVLATLDAVPWRGGGFAALEAYRVVGEIVNGDVDAQVAGTLTAAVGLIRLACNEIATTTGERPRDVAERLAVGFERLMERATPL